MSDFEIDNLSVLLKNITVSENHILTNKTINKNKKKMATSHTAATVEQIRTPQINWDLFKSKLSNIKPYDGDCNSLNKFIVRCDNLINTYQVHDDALMNGHILECIQEKLIGRAELMVGNRLEINTWPALKDALIQCFADRRDIDCIVQELTRARPLKNEHLNDFGSRLQLLRSSIISRISNDQTLNVNEKQMQANHYCKIALNTFIAGCSGVLKNNMHLKKPDSLEDAMAYVAEFENFERMYGNLNDRNPTQFKNNFNVNKQNVQSNNFQRNFNNPFQYRNNNNNPFQQQNFNQFSNNQFVPHVNQPNQFQNNNQNFGWSNQHNNMQPRFKNFSNSQVFGRPNKNINAFRPGQIPESRLPIPQPMSTTSRNSSMQSRRPYNNNYRNYNQNFRPQFAFEELHSNQYSNTDTTNEYDAGLYDEFNNYCQIDNQLPNKKESHNDMDKNNEPEINFQEPGPSNKKT